MRKERFDQLTRRVASGLLAGLAVSVVGLRSAAADIPHCAVDADCAPCGFCAVDVGQCVVPEGGCNPASPLFTGPCRKCYDCDPCGFCVKSADFRRCRRKCRSHHNCV